MNLSASSRFQIFQSEVEILFWSSLLPKMAGVPPSHKNGVMADMQAEALSMVFILP
jgi:hypothetical protein